MSLADTSTCMTFRTDREFLSKWDFAYVPFIHDNIKYIMKVQITDAQLGFNAYSKNRDETLYISYDIIHSLKKYYNRKVVKKFLGFKYNSTLKDYFFIEEKIKIENSFYSPDFYSIFCPTGFLYKEDICKTYDEALNAFDYESLKNHEFSKYIQYAIPASDIIITNKPSEITKYYNLGYYIAAKNLFDKTVDKKFLTIFHKKNDKYQSIDDVLNIINKADYQFILFKNEKDVFGL